MKTLKSILEASILADIDDQLEVGDECIKEQIRQFIKDKYVTRINISKNLIFSDEPNKDGKYEVSIDVYPYSIKLREDRDKLTNDLFVWGDVVGNFLCDHSNVTSLVGSPKHVILGNFNCSYCPKLKSLKGMPKRIDKNFYCYDTNVSLLNPKVSKISYVKGQICY